jgi:hypothetical protein
MGSREVTKNAVKSQDSIDKIEVWFQCFQQNFWLQCATLQQTLVLQNLFINVLYNKNKSGSFLFI